MVHLGVELDGISLLALNLIAGILDVVRRADATVIVRDTLNSVAVAHPNLRADIDAFEERRLIVNKLEVGATILTSVGLFNTSATPFSQILSTIAYSQQWEMTFYVGHVRYWSIGGVAGERASRKNNALDIRSERRNLVERMYFAINLTASGGLIH